MNLSEQFIEVGTIRIEAQDFGFARGIGPNEASWMSAEAHDGAISLPQPLGLIRV